MLCKYRGDRRCNVKSYKFLSAVFFSHIRVTKSEYVRLVCESQPMNADEFKEAFMPYRRKLYAVALRLLGNPEDAADAVQDAYVRFWNHRDAIARKDSPEAFCMAVVRNIAVDLLRNRRVAEPVEALADFPEEIDDKVAMEGKAKRVAELMKQLPPRQSEVMKMRDIQGLTFAEIGLAMGEREDNVRALLSRARKKVRELFFLTESTQ